MNDLTQIFTSENAQVIWQQRELSRTNENANFFYAFCRMGDDFYSLHLSRMQAPYVTSPKHVAMSNDLSLLINQKTFAHDIYLSRHRLVDGRLETLEKHLVDSAKGGTDPRIASNGQNAWAILYNSAGVDGLGAMLLDLRSLKVMKISFQSGNIKFGKNWQPFIENDQLFAVHELNPFRIIKIDVVTGVAEVIYEAESYVPIFSGYDFYPLVRGGANSIIRGDTLIGLGHATSEAFRHHPFLWTHQKKFGTTITFLDIFYRFTKCGYALIDPTTMFEDEESIYVGLDCHERDRQHEQRMLHILLKFDKNPSDKNKGNMSLLKFLEDEPVTEEFGIPNLKCHRFFCTELRSAVLHEDAKGVRASIGVPGHIVYGPYIKITHDGIFLAELAYLTKNDQKIDCGCFEVVVHKSNPDGTINVDSPLYLAQSSLEATSGVLMKKKLIFDTSGQMGNFLEFRVFASQDAIVSVWDIVTREQF